MNYLHGAKSIVKTQVAGVGVASPGVQAVRQAICRSCPKYHGQFWAGPRCMECGCLINLKVQDADEQCPLGKWK